MRVEVPNMVLSFRIISFHILIIFRMVTHSWVQSHYITQNKYRNEVSMTIDWVDNIYGKQTFDLSNISRSYLKNIRTQI